MVLEQSGLFEVEAFNDPVQALAIFKQDRYDVLILDVRLRDTEEFVLYNKIKTIDKKIKICFLTSVYDFDYYKALYPGIVDTIEKNEDCIIEKPVGTEKLIKEINKLLHCI